MPEPPRRPRPQFLTDYELHVARLAANGLTDQAIGRALRTSRRTATDRLTEIRTKLGARNRAHMVGILFRLRELHPNDIRRTPHDRTDEA